MSISDELKSLRRENDLTQDEAADRFNVSASAWQTWEQGIHTPGADKLDHIRRVLGQETKVASEPNNTDVAEHVVEYPCANGSGDSPTVKIDDRLIDLDGGMPTHAKVHCANGSLMGPYLADRCRVLVEKQKQVQGPGRYLFRWKGGTEKVVGYLNRWGDSSILLRRYAPREKVVIHHVEGDQYEHQDGTPFTMEMIGKVVYPPDSARQLTEEMLDKTQETLGAIGGGR
jgi:transcriptional regulator with XRE-family HTH domain